ncbi:hypothetical protein [Xylanimonas protaetiae]|uniref:Uncharacterized protein n=1 Tax=Xylanimonas protaetiae TaxID=2509457 RepID=A0A4P6F6L8_9MICO|nr:hypothetical protein [Xylanimonas protaetiae]QAY69969.1 hypothetical protein ET471_07935 [Xylanimonas protaetiae]
MSDIDTRPYTSAELHAIRTHHIPSDVAFIRDAWATGSEDKASFRAALALRTAAYYLRRGATAEAHDLVTRAAAAWDDGWKAREAALLTDWKTQTKETR